MTVITTAEWEIEVEGIAAQFRSQYHKGWYKKNKSLRKAQNLQLYYDNIEIRKAQKKRWLQRNRAKQAAYQRKCYWAKKARVA